MAIHVDVLLELESRRLKVQREQIGNEFRRDFERIGAVAGSRLADGFERATPRVRRASQNMAQAIDVVRVKETDLMAVRQKQESAINRLHRVEQQLANARRDAATDTETLAKLERQLESARASAANSARRNVRAEVEHARSLRGVADAQRALSDAVPDASTVAQLARFGMVLGNLGKVAGPAGLAAAGVGLAQLGGIAASASKSLWLLPAAVSAAGAGIGTLALGLNGFTDALGNLGDAEKFAEALQDLAPSAQEAASAIRGLVQGPFKELQQATQQSLFDGIGDQLTNLSSHYLPSIQQMTTSIAQSFNQMFSGVTNQLMTPETTAAMQSTMANIAQAFQNAAPAAQEFTAALADIMNAGSDFLPDLASTIAEAAESFASFIHEAKQSGQLNEWIAEGVETLGQLTDIAGNLADAFMSLAPAGESVLPSIARITGEIADIMPVISAAVTLLGPKFEDWNSSIFGISGTVKLIASAFEAIPSVVESVGNIVIGVMNNVGSAISRGLEPIRRMIDVANSFLPGSPIPQIYDWEGIKELNFDSPGAGDRGGRGRAVRPSGDRSGRGGGASATPSVPGGVRPGWGMPDTRTGWNPQTSYEASDPWTGPTSAGAGSASGTGILVSPQNSMAAIAYAQQQSGGAYSYGGVGPGSPSGLYDCSGFMSDLFAIMTGRPYSGNERFFTTESDFTALGFKPGFQQGAFNIGISRNGGGRNSHMAGTLPNGVNVESGGAAGFTQYGGTAAGADDPQFGLQYHLPVDQAFNPGYGVYADSPLDSSGPTPVTVESFGSAAASTMQQQIGAPLDQDFGISGGLPGIFENLFKVIANAAAAPIIGMLSGVTSVYGSAGPGTGLLGALAPRQSMGGVLPGLGGNYGPGMMAGPGGYGMPIPGYTPGGTGMAMSPMGMPAAPGLAPGLGSFGGPMATPGGIAPNGMPLGSPASGVGMGARPGYAPASYGAGAQPFGGIGQTGTSSTPTLGRQMGEGKEPSPGIGISGGGLIGLAQSAVPAAISAAASAGGAMAPGAGAAGPLISAAAQIGIDELNRAVQAGGQLIGIGVEGLLETFMPSGGSELADPARSWGGKLLGAVAGVRPTAQNLAGSLTEKMNGDGGNPPLSPEQAAAHQDSLNKGAAAIGQKAGDTSITVNNSRATEDGTGRDIVRHQTAANAKPGPQR